MSLYIKQGEDNIDPISSIQNNEIITSSDPMIPKSPSNSILSTRKGEILAANAIESNEAVADIRKHYDSIRDTGKKFKSRNESPIYYVKNFNNWIKAVLIRTYAYPGCNVLDIACGKGGDLLKWSKANISSYVGIDISSQAIDDAMERYKGRSSDKQYGMSGLGDVKFMCYDCCEDLPSFDIPPGGKFDLVSCQFALHYAFQTEKRARTMLKNISKNLKEGGIFFCTIPNETILQSKLYKSRTSGNDLYKINFTYKYLPSNYRTNPFGVEYVFSLDDAIYECPEYLVNLDVLRILALEYDLVMESHKTFDYLYHTNKIKHKDLINKMKLHRNLIPDNQYEVCCLYISVVFKKKFKNV